MERRRFLQLGATVGVGASVAASPLLSGLVGARPLPTSVATGRAYVPVPAYPAGVVSGDPTSSGIVLWTRIDPVVAGAGTTVGWQVASDPAFPAGSIVASGSAPTVPTADHTVHAEVTGLAPGTTYWYRFDVAGTASPVGRTRTLPVGQVDHLRIAYFSCQRYVHGYFDAHADLAARALDPATDVDLVICLGDYVYEAGPADDVTVAGRVDPEAETVTHEDFRRQYHLYRTDLDLQAMHAAFPMVAIFDNHDGFSQPSDPAGPGARSAFFEQMPVRRNDEEPNRQYRSFALGDLCELFLLDERQYRDPIAESGPNALGTTTVEQPLVVAEGRTMLGAAQKAWLQDSLAGSSAAWKILGSQLVFSPLRSQLLPDVQAAAGDGPQRNAGRYVNLIGWDGYQAERRELVDHLVDAGVDDVLAIAGDAHFWTTSELPQDWDDPASIPVLAEFAGSSVTSANAGEEPGLPGNDLIRPVVAKANPYHLRYIEVTTHGYGLIDLTSSGASVSYISPESITVPDAPSAVLARFEVDRGSAVVRQVEGTGFLPRPAVDPAPPTTTVPGEPGPGTAVPAAPVAGAPSYTG
ncbi:alkaline phosphatase D family protein [Aquihabitans sp. G128]|uniref:alkaline phosphatase D family protein n=1 Tax=Aquihabitans sp. G128 TaxID=2849779 RepID=UPI001C22A692|nr:alkaline phosphatase D family protein [Aquihabitans sp. G128]QXC60012.1 alkaline phosphatase D family protein [Aquihabitans sp. G128]